PRAGGAAPRRGRGATASSLDGRHAPGAARLAGGAPREGAGLRATNDPLKPSYTLWWRLLRALNARRMVKGAGGRPADPDALAVVEAALLAGPDYPDSLVPRVGKLDLDWLCAHAGGGVRAQPGVPRTVRYAVA